MSDCYHILFEFSLLYHTTTMKRKILLFAILFFSLLSYSQTVTLAIHQDYQVPEIPLITQIGDTLESTSPIGNQWFMDGIELLGENKQTLVMTKSGNYKVSVTLGSGCSSESLTFSAIKTDVSIIITDDFTCKVFPNPNFGLFTIEFESEKSEVFELELFTSSGEFIVKQTIDHSSGKQQIPFGITSLADGVYYLKIKHGSNILSRQIIVNK